ncbi:hypothetical protein Q8W71_01135 [Methylobacterium sp. NEAU 140]|uniref:hypothetical protein n=1 Tax=Methylobacterium sp. NEAU 140 TaxID=3064945 RepID=UPI0027328F34|nr:hypothetical protein [Methylobacterium sp. NEAU 140]MDP4021213.1 hypothetical protein [Methylobacterium sp. NEAU 140]
MLNFVFGTVAGGLIACVLTIVAVRHPEVQTRLGLVPPPVMTLAAATRPSDAACRKTGPGPSVGTQEMLFNRHRFWSVAP